MVLNVPRKARIDTPGIIKPNILKGQPICVTELPLTRGWCCEPIASLSIAAGFLGEGLVGLAWRLNVINKHGCTGIQEAFFKIHG
jgi:hypothetical protein